MENKYWKILDTYVGIMDICKMGKRKKRFYSTTQCPCCFRKTEREIPIKFKKFRRFDHYEEMYVRRMGVVCTKCGYIISEEGLIDRIDIPIVER